MRLSRYTYLFQRDNEYFIFSSRSGNFYKIPGEFFDFLKEIESQTEIPEEFSDAIEDLKKRKFIATEEEDNDFFDALKYRWTMKAYQTSHLALTLVPTEWCNLRCPYCFEKEKKPKYMDDDTIEALIEFVKGYSASTYSICWYGGEPLLAIDRIEKILDSLNKIEDKKLSFHSIVTNGTLLNEKAIEVFKKYPLQNIQITFDGMKDTHDQRRITHAGDGTFDVIITNLKRAVDELPDTQFNIRVNVDRLNSKEFGEVCDMIAREFEGHKNIGCYPGILEGDTDCSDTNMFSEGSLLEFYDELRRERGIDRIQYPIRNIGGCTATAVCSHVIGADGALYRCWEDVGLKELQIGNIHDKKLSNEKLLRQFMSCNPYESEECRECGLLPVCSGGCPRKRFDNKFKGMHHGLLCTLHKYNDSKALFDYLINFYRMQKERKECECKNNQNE